MFNNVIISNTPLTMIKFFIFTQTLNFEKAIMDTKDLFTLYFKTREHAPRSYDPMLF